MRNRRVEVVIINGEPQSGKDTFAKCVCQLCKDGEMANVYNISSIDPVKDVLYNLGWDGDKTDYARSMLHQLKNFWVTNNDGPTKYIIDKIMEYTLEHRTSSDDIIIFVHIREPLEIDKLRLMLKSFGYLYSIRVHTLIVNRNLVHREAFSNEADSHTSEYRYDITINNDGTINELRDMASNFINIILGGE